MCYAALAWSAPLHPPIIYGETIGETGPPYRIGVALIPLKQYPLVAFPEIYVDWGDNTNTGWFVPQKCYGLPGGPFRKICDVQHFWETPGTYSIQAKSRDPETLIESSWSNSLSVQVNIGSNIIAFLENPSPYLYQQSGIATIYGWALHPQGISKIELFIDDQFVGNIPYGGLRLDIKEIYPGYINSDYSGFAMIYDFSQLYAGAHEMKVRIYNQEGQPKDLTASFFVLKFHGDFVQNMSPSSRLLRFNRVTADGVTKRYDIHIDWISEIQGFKIISIMPLE
jgi:hypothetical protein